MPRYILVLPSARGSSVDSKSVKTKALRGKCNVGLLAKDLPTRTLRSRRAGNESVAPVQVTELIVVLYAGEAVTDGALGNVGRMRSSIAECAIGSHVD
jgi:hypothetical protein